MPELRKDPIVDRWVIIAPERSMRPSAFSSSLSHFNKSEFCPLCPGNENLTPPEIIALRPEETKPNTPGWTLRVVPNKFPVLRIEGQLSKQQDPIFQHMEGVGAHEIIIETSNHEKQLSDLSNDGIKNVLLVYRDRIRDLRNDIRFEYIHVFKNQGWDAGATLPHSHSQLIALPIIPEIPAEEISGAESYYQKENNCIFCELLNREKKVKSRLVKENADFLSFTPYASRVPFELWIIPKSHTSNYEDSNDNLLASMAEILKDSLLRLKAALQDPSYNYYIHSLPLKPDSHQRNFYHWHLEIIPKINHFAGFEVGSGFYVNPLPPEDAGEFLRNLNI